MIKKMKEEQEFELKERIKFIQSMNEEGKRNYFIRRNHILKRNCNDAEETRSKSQYFSSCLDENLLKELNNKMKMVKNVQKDEKIIWVNFFLFSSFL